MVFSTNDYTTGGTAPPPVAWSEDGWADVKTVRAWFPSTGTWGTRTYSVGATTVREVLDPPSVAGYFSYSPVELSTGMQGFPPPTSGTSRRKVVILQAVDGTQNAQAIAWQRYFYGESSLAPQLGGYESNPRAVAVLAAKDAADVRVAICGEVFDEDLPADGLGTIGTATRPSGFIAVYNGDGVLRWSHLLYGALGTGNCAVTDLSIRVVEVEGQKQDLVTYCGVSTFGLLTSGPLAPVAPFTSVPGATGYTPGVGNTNNGQGQWDGFVGRLRHDESLGTTTTDFHSIVGGTAQDGLFGLAELDDYTFIVVGTTRRGPLDGPMAAGYPFTEVYPAAWGMTPWTSSSWYSVGVYTIFTTSNVLTTGLDVSYSAWAGAVAWNEASQAWTHCHDVAPTPLYGGYHIVGGTNDTNFLARSAPQFRGGAVNAPGTKLNLATGDCDGFVMWTGTLNNSQPATVGLFGTDRPDVMTGVSAWSEYPSYAAFSGWEFHPSASAQQIRCGAIAQGGVVRDLQILDGTLAHPAATPGAQALSGQGAEFYFDEPASGFAKFSAGGIALDDRGRANAVGMSLANYPYQVQNFPSGNAPQHPWAVDAVRSTVDLLPQGVSRTDGTGTRVRGATPGGWEAPPQPSGYDGGTTPTGTASNPCRAEFGWQIGHPLGEVSRVLIDYRGDAPGNGVSASVVSEGFIGGAGLLAALMQIGLPPTAPLVIDTAEVWTVANPQALTLAGSGWAYTEWQLPTMIPGPLQFTVQVLWLLQTPLACDSASLVASPGMVIDY